MLCCNEKNLNTTPATGILIWEKPYEKANFQDIGFERSAYFEKKDLDKKNWESALGKCTQIAKIMPRTSHESVFQSSQEVA